MVKVSDSIAAVKASVQPAPQFIDWTWARSAEDRDADKTQRRRLPLNTFIAECITASCEGPPLPTDKAEVKKVKLKAECESWYTFEGRNAQVVPNANTAICFDVDPLNDGLFLDESNARDVSKRLSDLGLSHVIRESFSSRPELRRWHFILFIVPMSIKAELETAKDAWKKAYNALAQTISQYCEIDKITTCGASTDKLTQIFYKRPKGLAIGDYTGKVLDLLAWLTASGREDVAAQLRGEAQQPQPQPQQQTQQKRQQGRPRDAAKAAPQAQAAAPDLTPGYSVGDLLRLAFNLFERYGVRPTRETPERGPLVFGRDFDGKPRNLRRTKPRIEDHRYELVCPWHLQHISQPGDESVSCSTSAWENPKTLKSSGFSCLHDGCAVDGVHRSTYDVLSLARRLADATGCDFPDRASWGEGASDDGSDDESEADELADALRRRYKAEFLKSLPKDGRPIIWITKGELARVVDATSYALGRLDVFVYGGRLVEVRNGVIHTLNASSLLTLLSKAALFCKHGKPSARDVGRPMRIDAPKDLSFAVLGASAWPGIRELQAIVDHPVLLRSGEVLRSGYDADTRLLVIPRPDTVFDIPESPTLADARAAAAELLWFSRNFRPTDEALGKAVFLAAALSVADIGRSEKRPAFCVSAAEAASGKTAWALVAASMIIGQVPIAKGINRAMDAAETDKLLPDSYPPGCRVAIWDNVPKVAPFGNESFDMVIERGRKPVRILHSSNVVTVDARACTSFVTGNGLSVAIDTASRALLLRIRRSSSAVDFRPDDERFWRSASPRCVVAALTILIAHAKHGSPQPPSGRGCRFEEWSSTVRAAVWWVTGTDPWSADPGAADVVGSDKSRMFHTLYRIHGFRSFDAASLVASMQPPRRQFGESEEEYRQRRAPFDSSEAAKAEIRECLRSLNGGREAAPLHSPIQIGKALTTNDGVTTPLPITWTSRVCPGAIKMQLRAIGRGNYQLVPLDDADRDVGIVADDGHSDGDAADSDETASEHGAAQPHSVDDVVIAPSINYVDASGFVDFTQI